jgi:hypothetical protein
MISRHGLFSRLLPGRAQQPFPRSADTAERLL